MKESELLDLVIRAREREDQEAWDRIIRQFLPLLHKYARLYSREGMETEDLLSEGLLGLTLAVRRFDPDRGVKFLTWATWYVWGRVRNSIRQSKFDDGVRFTGDDFEVSGNTVDMCAFMIRDEVEEALRELSPSHRATVAGIGEGKSRREIAEEQGVGVLDIRQQVRQVRGRLQKIAA